MTIGVGARAITPAWGAFRAPDRGLFRPFGPPRTPCHIWQLDSVGGGAYGGDGAEVGSALLHQLLDQPETKPWVRPFPKVEGPRQRQLPRPKRTGESPSALRMLDELRVPSPCRTGKNGPEMSGGLRTRPNRVLFSTL